MRCDELRQFLNVIIYKDILTEGGDFDRKKLIKKCQKLENKQNRQAAQQKENGRNVLSRVATSPTQKDLAVVASTTLRCVIKVSDISPEAWVAAPESTLGLCRSETKKQRALTGDLPSFLCLRELI